MNSLNANRNAPLIHGKEAQFLVEKIVRERIFECIYWKEHCFSLDLYSLIQKAFYTCNYVGGTIGANSKPVPFLCLLLKLLQLLPPREIVLEVLQWPDGKLKYLKCLFLTYHRLVAPALEVYKVIEPFVLQSFKIRFCLPDGTFTIRHIDEFADDLLVQERVLGIILPRLTRRSLLESTGHLQPKEAIHVEFTETQPEAEQAQQPKKNVKKLSFKKQSTKQEKEEDPSLAVLKEKKLAKEQEAESLSLEATNELRISLGLKPLAGGGGKL
jgi:pre-mRNA-splicing factor 38A